MEADWFVAATAGSEAGAVARRVDWAATSIGPPGTWPPELRMAVELCFGTRFPVLVAWGPELVKIYNDAYRPMLGSAKHPRAMGAPAAEVWHEVWDQIGPLFDRVLRTGEPTWAVDQQLLVSRSGFVEETYFTYSYSPIRDDSGRIGGVLDIATETTEQVVDRRRMRCLGELSGSLHAVAGDVEGVGRVTVDVLARHVDDVPAAALYLRTSDDRLALLAATGARQTASVVDVETLERVARERLPTEVGSTVVAPLATAGDAGAGGVVVLHASPRRPFDAGYRSFLHLVASPITTAMSGAIRQTQELGELRRVSEALQQAMLPEIADVRGIAGRYRPAAGNLAVGGDWYDVVELDGSRLALLVGDCVGHGLEAAALMGQLRSASRALLLENNGAAATVEGLDRFARSLEGAECTTVFCGIADEVAGTFTYASAGHPPGLVLHAEGVSWLDRATDVPLAVLDDRTRAEATVGLDDVRALVLYTDGFIERRGQSIDVGLHRLAQTAGSIASAEPIEAIAEVLVEELLAADAADDAALLVYRPGLKA